MRRNPEGELDVYSSVFFFNDGLNALLVIADMTCWLIIFLYMIWFH